jgi:hypothetical protein
MRSQDGYRVASAPRAIVRSLLSKALVLVALVAAAEIGAPTEVASTPHAAGLPAGPRVTGEGPPRAEGEVSTRRLPRPPARAARAARDRPVPRPDRIRPTGRLMVAPGASRVSGSGPVKSFLVEVEKGLPVDRRAFAITVQRILFDERGWTARGRLAFKRVDSGPVDFKIALSSPRTTDRLCAPLETAGRYSCHQDGRAVLNYKRWRRGARAYGRDLEGYRTYLVNHEAGHALGLSWHPGCPHPGARAPVMMQQTMGVGECRPHPWPRPEERLSLI